METEEIPAYEISVEMKQERQAMHARSKSDKLMNEHVPETDHTNTSRIKHSQSSSIMELDFCFSTSDAGESDCTDVGRHFKDRPHAEFACHIIVTQARCLYRAFYTDSFTSLASNETSKNATVRCRTVRVESAVCDGRVSAASNISSEAPHDFAIATDLFSDDWPVSRAEPGCYK